MVQFEVIEWIIFITDIKNGIIISTFFIKGFI